MQIIYNYFCLQILVLFNEFGRFLDPIKLFKFSWLLKTFYAKEEKIYLYFYPLNTKEIIKNNNKPTVWLNYKMYKDFLCIISFIYILISPCQPGREEWTALEFRLKGASRYSAVGASCD